METVIDTKNAVESREQSFLIMVNLAPVMLSVLRSPTFTDVVDGINRAVALPVQAARLVVKNLGKRWWAAEAARLIGHTHLLFGNAIIRNRRITRAYVGMYADDPARMKWAGLAAFASHSIGDKLLLLLAAISGGAVAVGGSVALGLPLVALAVSMVLVANIYLYQRTALGNKTIYTDIYWQHMAYRDGGIAEIARLYHAGDLPEALYQAWQDIDAGANGDARRMWQGNTDMLHHEQYSVIQPILYAGRLNTALWKVISMVHDHLNILLTSPVPGDRQTFRDYARGGNLANFDQRWHWCTARLMPQWEQVETTQTAHTLRLLQAY